MVWVKRAVSLLLLAVVIYFFWPMLSSIREAAGLFKYARWGWLLVAVLAQVISYMFLIWLNDLALRPFAGRIGFWQLGAVLTSLAFIQIAIPSGGVSSAALRVRLLSRYGYDPEDSLFSLFVESLSEIIALASIAALGVAYLLQRGSMSLVDLGWSTFFVLGLALLVWVVWQLLLDETHSRRILHWIVAFWNRRLKRLRTLDAPQLEVRLANFRKNLGRYRHVSTWKFVLASYGKVLFDIACMGACFALFGYGIIPGTLFTGYGLVLTFSGVAALPGGLGAGDASVPVVFSWLSVPAAAALAAGLTYRLIAFWLVRFVGFITWQVLEAKPKRLTNKNL